MLKIDQVTSLLSRGQFARICVELDLRKPIESNVVARGLLLQLEYEGLHTICFKCGLYGHLDSKCIKSITKDDKKGEEQAVPAEGTHSQVPKVGDEATKNPQPNAVRADVSLDTSATQQIKNKEPTKSGIGSSINPEEKEYGPWMLVKRQKRKPK